MGGSVTLIRARIAWLERVDGYVKTFQRSVSTARDDPTVVKAARRLDSDCKHALTALGRLPKPAHLVYSNQLLRQYLGALSGGSRSLSTAIDKSDRTLVFHAVGQIRQALGSDWVYALFAADQKGLDGYVGELKDLANLDQQARSERDSLAQPR